MTTRVLNLATRQEQFYSSSPREAVIAAYAQSVGDWNTWDYEARYGSLAMMGRFTVSCGDFCATLEIANNTPDYRAQVGDVVEYDHRRYRIVGVHNIPEVSPNFAQMLTVEGIRGTAFTAKIYYREGKSARFEIATRLPKMG